MKWKLAVLAAVSLAGALLPACSETQKEGEVKPSSSPASYAAVATVKNQLAEDRYLYGNDKGDEVTHLYLTVLQKGTGKGGDGTLYSFDDINHIQTRMPVGQGDAELAVLLQEGDEKGPAAGRLGYGTSEANGTIQIRGSSTRSAAQKSYKIKLFDGAGMWREQKVLNLNKHAADLSRIRNKLSFDYYKLLPDSASLRTHFVHLYVRDLTKSNPPEGFKDYGLYTEIENPGKNYLKQHGFDANGSLYKATDFAFYRYPESLRLMSDPEYNEAVFEQILSIEGNPNHDKLLNMLDEVNDYSLNINQVVETHFNRDNMLTWVGVNILMGNLDTISQNYMLYSPQNSQTWYFFPWDYDGAWDWYNQPLEPTKPANWQEGIANYWSNVLLKRFFMDPGNVQELNRKLEELRTYINPEQTKEFLTAYYSAVKPYIYNDPDVIHLPGYLHEFEEEFQRLPQISELNLAEYYKKLENPMPIFLGEPELAEGKVTFAWDPSYDLQGDDLTYHFQVAPDHEFKTVMYEQKNLTVTRLSIPPLAKGTYYWRVLVADSKGNEQIPFDSVDDHRGNVYHGMKMYTVND